MIQKTKNKRFTTFFKVITAFVIICFSSTTVLPYSLAQAQSLTYLPKPGVMVPVSAGFVPPMIKGLKVYPDNPFRFDFLIDPGDAQKEEAELREEFTKLIKYFMATLAIPDNDLWVNLAPGEKDRVIMESFGVTEMGRDLLLQDYLLKQIASSLTHPQEEIGRQYWAGIYEKAFAIYGTTDIPVNMLNRIWVAPGSAEVYINRNTALITESNLQVLVEDDYLELAQTEEVSPLLKEFNTSGDEEIDRIALELTREFIIPAIQKDVDQGKNFYRLRQIYNAIILANWYKRHLRESIFGQLYVDKEKVKGVDIEDYEAKEKIYQQYISAIEKGVFNFIKDDYDPATQEVIPRKYFSGGMDFTSFAMLGDVYRETSDPSALEKISIGALNFFGRTFRRVSSVVISQEGVEHYQKLEMVQRRPKKSLSKWLASLLVAGIFGSAPAAFSAEYGYDSDGKFVAKFGEFDNFSGIVETLRVTQKKEDGENYREPLKGEFWGENGAVQTISQQMGIDDPDYIQTGSTLVFPDDLISEKVQTTLAGSQPAPTGLQPRQPVRPPATIEETPQRYTTVEPQPENETGGPLNEDSREVISQVDSPLQPFVDVTLPNAVELNGHMDNIDANPIFPEMENADTRPLAKDGQQPDAPAPLKEKSAHHEKLPLEPYVDVSKSNMVEFPINRGINKNNNLFPQMQNSDGLEGAGSSNVSGAGGSAGGDGGDDKNQIFGPSPYWPSTNTVIGDISSVELPTHIEMLNAHLTRYWRDGIIMLSGIMGLMLLANSRKPFGISPPESDGEEKQDEGPSDFARRIMSAQQDLYTDVIASRIKQMSQSVHEFNFALDQAVGEKTSALTQLLKTVLEKGMQQGKIKEDDLSPGSDIGSLLEKLYSPRLRKIIAQLLQEVTQPEAVEEFIQTFARALAVERVNGDLSDFELDVKIETFIQTKLTPFLKARMSRLNQAFGEDGVLGEKWVKAYDAKYWNFLITYTTQNGRIIDYRDFSREIAESLMSFLHERKQLVKKDTLTQQPDVSVDGFKRALIQKMKIYQGRRVQVRRAARQAAEKLLNGLSRGLQMRIQHRGFNDLRIAAGDMFVPDLTNRLEHDAWRHSGMDDLDLMLLQAAEKLTRQAEDGELSEYGLRQEMTQVAARIEQRAEEKIKETDKYLAEKFLSEDNVKMWQIAGKLAAERVEFETLNNGEDILPAALMNFAETNYSRFTGGEFMVEFEPFYLQGAGQSLEQLAGQVEEAPAAVPVRRENSRAPPLYSITRADIVSLAGSSLLLLKPEMADSFSTWLALASPFLFRAGLSVSYFLHELTHTFMGGPKAWLRPSNYLGNVPLKQWLAMQVPFIGKLPARFSVKAKASFLNRAAGLLSSLTLTGGAGWGIAQLWTQQLTEYVQIGLPLGLGAFFVAADSFFRTDGKDILTNAPDDGEVCCGVKYKRTKHKPGEKGGAIVRLKELKQFQWMSRVNNIRGDQGNEMFVVARKANGQRTFVSGRIVKGKRADSVNQARRALHWDMLKAKGKLVKGDPMVTEIGGHDRFGTSSSAHPDDIQPVQWLPEREVELWTLSDGHREKVKQNLGIKVLYNGDLIKYQGPERMYDEYELGVLLSMIHRHPNYAFNDAGKVSGLMDLLRSQGDFRASILLSYYFNVADSWNEVIGGMEVPTTQEWFNLSDEQYDGFSDQKKRDLYKKMLHELPNNSLSVKERDVLAQALEREYERTGDQLIFQGVTSHADFWVSQEEARTGSYFHREQRQRIEGFKKRVRARLEKLPIVKSWKNEAKVEQFIEGALEAFFRNDEETILHKFIDNVDSKSAFGMILKSTLYDGVMGVADGQPIALGYDQDMNHFVIGSEPSTAFVGLDTGEDSLDFTLPLRQEPGNGEIYVSPTNGELKIYSRKLKRTLTQAEITRRQIPLKGNPYMEYDIQTNDDDPIAEDMTDTQKILNKIKQRHEDKDSFNNQSGREVLRFVIEGHIKEQIKERSREFNSLRPEMHETAVQMAQDFRDGLVAQLVEDMSAGKWEISRRFERFHLEARPLIEAALHQAFDEHTFDARLNQKVEELARTLMEREIDSIDLNEHMDLYVANELPGMLNEELMKATEMIQEILDYRQDQLASHIWLNTVTPQTERASDVNFSGIAMKELNAIWEDHNLRKYIPKPRHTGLNFFAYGLEVSDEVGRQFMKDLEYIIPQVPRTAVSANKSLDDPKEYIGITPDSVGFGTGQSGQGFPSLNTTILSQQLIPGRNFVLTGQLYSLMGQAVGQEYQPDSPFTKRIFTNFTGYRRSEAVTLTATASHAVYTELLIQLADGLKEYLSDEQPFGFDLSHEDIRLLKEKRDSLIDESGRITGTSKEEAPERKTILRTAKRWAQHVLDVPFAKVFSRIHLYLTVPVSVVLGFLLFPSIFAALGWVSIPLLIGAGILQAALYDGFPELVTFLRRVFQKREKLARAGNRTVVIGDNRFVANTLEMQMTKEGALSKASTEVSVLKSNPTDRFASEHAHRVRRGTLLMLGLTDENKLSKAADQTRMTGRQAKGIRNFGVGAEVVSIGRKRKKDPNASDVDIMLSTQEADYSNKISKLVDGRFDSTARLIAGQVYIHHMMKTISTLNLPKKWQMLWPWRWKNHRTQSGARIPTTQYPTSTEKLAEILGRSIVGIDKENKKFKPAPKGKLNSAAMTGDNSLQESDPALTVVTEPEPRQMSAPTLKEEVESRRENPATPYSRETQQGKADEDTLPETDRFDVKPQSVTEPLSGEAKNVGGIDMRSGVMNTHFMNSPGGIGSDNLHVPLVDPAMLKDLPNNTFIPVIFQIVPNSIDMFLGEVDQGSDVMDLGRKKGQEPASPNQQRYRKEYARESS